MRADPPEWLTTWLGRRPTDGPGAAVWDDAVARIARHRTAHETDDATPGLGPQPLDPMAAASWQEAMLRTLRDRIWLTERQLEPRPIGPTMSATAMHERRAELQALMHTAPADHRELIERLTTGHAGSTEVHDPHRRGQRTAGAARLDRRQLAPRRRTRTAQRNHHRQTRPRPLANSGTAPSPVRARRHGLYRYSPTIA
jgi:hypothetical protein